jgi:hypothetical protein
MAGRTMSKISMAANAPATDCKTVVVAATPNCRPEFIRLPKLGLCPITGLSRSKIYTLILPHEDNNYKPPVASVSLRKTGQLKGTRLVVLESLLAYLRDEVEVFQRSIGKGAEE